jgi:hypothetical protein
MPGGPSAGAVAVEEFETGVISCGSSEPADDALLHDHIVMEIPTIAVKLRTLLFIIQM